MALKSNEPSRTFGAGKRWAARLQVAIGVILALYILLVVNLIAFRHPMRFDLTAEGQHSLSDATLKRLESVNQEIRIVFPTYLPPDLERQHPELLANRRVLRRARFLLEEYMAAQPNIRIVEELDVFAEPDRWTDVRNRYQLTASQVNRFVFLAGKGGEFRQTVTAQDLAVFGPTRDASTEPEIKAFRGEKVFTDTITRLIRRERRPVYFTQDNQEMALQPRTVQDPGIAALARELETSGFEVRPLAVGSTAVPADCEILFIVRPVSRFSELALGRIETYLEDGGRLFAALGPQNTGLEDLLGRWGVDVEDGGVIERSLGGTTRRDSSEPRARRFNPTHPATSVFSQATRFEVVLYAPRPLTPGGRSRGLEGVGLLELLTSADTGTSFYHITRDNVTGSGGLNLPRPGDYTVAVAVGQLVPDRPPPGFQRLDTRVFCIGSASFLGDHLLPQFSHRDFMFNGVMWLVGEEEQASVGAQEWTTRTLKMGGSIREFLFWVPIFVFPGICLVMGGFVYFVRRT